MSAHTLYSIEYIARGRDSLGVGYQIHVDAADNDNGFHSGFLKLSGK